MLRITKIEELRIAKQEGMLNIQPLALKLPPHSSSSSSECVKGKAYDEKIHFVQTIIQDINTTRTYVVEFLDISKRRCSFFTKT